MPSSVARWPPGPNAAVVEPHRSPRAFGSTQKGHPAGAPCALSCRGHSPRPMSSPTYRHRPLLSLGEKSHPGPRGGHVWTPAAVPARPAATRALHRVRWSCGGTSFPQQPSNPHAVGRAGSLGCRHPCGRTAVPRSSGSGFPVVKSKPACSVCQGWLSFGLPIIASCRKQCHVGGQGHASGFSPAAQVPGCPSATHQSMEPSVHCYRRMLISRVRGPGDRYLTMMGRHPLSPWNGHHQGGVGAPEPVSG